ncbi:hypothetical protein DSO57_1015297 [Entomophthora muscae]|uniref:Uncharacterized protein n=1 Tax=Entomophthora muscae TaxID=34485 RepID=A0ACC2SU05_9FUNG|nr:hypothetical protein DSO57_1015297 [Entomophthora muscae]
MTYFLAFDLETKLSIRNFILNVLATRPDLQPFVITALGRLFTVITKLGWFDSPEFRSVNVDVAKFLENEIRYRTIGLQLLSIMIDDISISPTPLILQASLKEKKVSSEFKDSQLLDAFTMAFSKVTELLAYEEDLSLVDSFTKYVDALLSLIKACVSFDFISTQDSENLDESGSTQFPSSWKPLISQTNFIPSFFALYRKVASPQSHKVLSCLVNIASTRRSMFHEDEARDFVLAVTHELTEILVSGHGLNDVDNHHEFCRVLARFRTTFQLSNIADRDIYWKWIKALGDFTISSLGNWEMYPNSLPYLMGVWVKIVASSWNLSPAGNGNMMGAELHVIPSQIFNVFLESRFRHVEQMTDPDYFYEDMLDRPELLETLEHIATIARYRYMLSSDLLINTHAEVMREYDEALANAAPDVTNKELQTCEGKLAWIVYSTGALLAGRIAYQSVDEEDIADADLSARVFRLVEPSNSLIGQMGRRMATHQTKQLNFALLYFFDQFQASYISNVSYRVTLVYTRMAQLSTIQDAGVALGIMLQRILANLQSQWADADKLIESSIHLLARLASGYNVVRKLRTMSQMEYLLTHHSPHHFAFMLNPANISHRARFYEALGRIIFSGEETSPLLDDFLNVFDASFQDLAAIEDPADYFMDTVKFAVSGLARDLQGLLFSALTRKNFSLLYDWFSSNYSQHMMRACQLYADSTEEDPDSVIKPLVALLKFYGELVMNRAQRLNFPIESAGGVILFRQVSVLMCSIAQRITRLSERTGSVPTSHIKLVVGYLRIMRHLFKGNYICFGVFALYNDPSLTNFYQAYFQLINAISPHEVFIHLKLRNIYFDLLELFIEDHLPSIGFMDNRAFVTINQVLARGVQNSTEVHISSSACRSLDLLVMLLYKNRDKGNQYYLNQLYATHEDLLALLFDSMFSTILETELSNLWAYSRPVLSFLTYNRQLFVDFSRRLLSHQIEASRAPLEQLLSRLVENIQEDMEPKTREILTNRLSNFSREIHSNQIAIVPLPLEPYMLFSSMRI